MQLLRKNEKKKKIVTSDSKLLGGTLSLKQITNKETWTLKGLLPLLLKRRLFTNFNMFVFKLYPSFAIFQVVFKIGLAYLIKKK